MKAWITVFPSLRPTPPKAAWFGMSISIRSCLSECLSACVKVDLGAGEITQWVWALPALTGSVLTPPQQPPNHLSPQSRGSNALTLHGVHSSWCVSPSWSLICHAVPAWESLPSVAHHVLIPAAHCRAPWRSTMFYLNHNTKSMYESCQNLL